MPSAPPQPLPQVSEGQVGKDTFSLALDSLPRSLPPAPTCVLSSFSLCYCAEVCGLVERE